MSHLFHEEGSAAQGQKVMLATPAYDSPCASYTFSIARTREALTSAGIQSSFLLLVGNPHVDDARNCIVRHFLESDCTDLLFLDADVDWPPEAVVQLCLRDRDVIGGVYPYRREGSEEMPVRLKAGATPTPDNLLEVDGLPTGFLRIRRPVLIRMAAAAPHYFDKVYETALVFDRPPPGPDRVRWGGDIDFCNRWRALGGTVWADLELRLGHTAKIILRDSLGAHLRRVTGSTLRHLAPRFREGTELPSDYDEVFKYAGNPYAADSEVLALVTGVARKCRGPIIETGSGLSSVLMALSTTERIYSLEHIDHYAAQTHAWATEAGVSGNLGICYAPLAPDMWYDLPKFDLPSKFTLGFCDGPPRLYGTRMRFFTDLAPRCAIIVADDVKSDLNFLRRLQEWCTTNHRHIELLGRAALITKVPAPL